jgi:hypothetical protein
VGLAGFEPTTFTRKQRLSVPTGFSKTAPEFRHSSGRGQQTRCLLSGARRHACLDYSPTLGIEALKCCSNKNIYVNPVARRSFAFV